MAKGYTYKVVAIPRDVEMMRGVSGPTPAERVAGYVEQVINQQAQEGWEFYRMDTVNITEKPGCLGQLLGQKEATFAYNLLIFRKPGE